MHQSHPNTPWPGLTDHSSPPDDQSPRHEADPRLARAGNKRLLSDGTLPPRRSQRHASYPFVVHSRSSSHLPVPVSRLPPDGSYHPSPHNIRASLAMPMPVRISGLGSLHCPSYVCCYSPPLSWQRILADHPPQSRSSESAMLSCYYSHSLLRASALPFQWFILTPLFWSMLMPLRVPMPWSSPTDFPPPSSCLTKSFLWLGSRRHSQHRHSCRLLYQ